MRHQPSLPAPGCAPAALAAALAVHAAPPRAAAACPQRQHDLPPEPAPPPFFPPHRPLAAMRQPPARLARKQAVHASRPSGALQADASRWGRWRGWQVGWHAGARCLAGVAGTREGWHPLAESCGQAAQSLSPAPRAAERHLCSRGCRVHPGRPHSPAPCPAAAPGPPPPVPAAGAQAGGKTHPPAKAATRQRHTICQAATLPQSSSHASPPPCGSHTGVPASLSGWRACSRPGMDPAHSPQHPRGSAPA